MHGDQVMINYIPTVNTKLINAQLVMLWCIPIWHMYETVVGGSGLPISICPVVNAVAAESF